MIKMLTKEQIRLIDKIEEHLDIIKQSRKMIRTTTNEITQNIRYIEILKTQYEMLE